MMRITEYEDKVAYFEAAQQMEKYPDAFAPGTAIFKKRPNRRIFTYVIIMQSGHHMSGVIPFSELYGGRSVEDHLHYLYELNK